MVAVAVGTVLVRVAAFGSEGAVMKQELYMVSRKGRSRLSLLQVPRLSIPFTLGNFSGEWSKSLLVGREGTVAAVPSRSRFLSAECMVVLVK